MRTEHRTGKCMFYHPAFLYITQALCTWVVISCDNTYIVKKKKNQLNYLSRKHVKLKIQPFTNFHLANLLVYVQANNLTLYHKDANPMLKIDCCVVQQMSSLSIKRGPCASFSQETISYTSIVILKPHASKVTEPCRGYRGFKKSLPKKRQAATKMWFYKPNPKVIEL